jgi:hypothetical protein
MMLRTRKTKSTTTTTTIGGGGGGSGSVFKGIKGKRTKRKQILNLFIGVSLVVFFSLFVYDIDDLEEEASSAFRDGKGKKLDDDARRDERKKKRRNHEEEKEKEEEYSTRSQLGRNGSQLGSAVTPNARFDVRSSFAQSFAALSKGNGNGGSFPYRYVFDLLLFARLCRVFQ